MIQVNDNRTEAPITREIAPAELGHSLLALIQTHSATNTSTISQTPGDNQIVTPPGAQTRQSATDSLEKLSAWLEISANARQKSSHAAREHSLRMAQIYVAIIEILDLLRVQATRPATVDESFSQFQNSLTQTSELQIQTIESTLRQIEIQRQSQNAEHRLQIETLQIHAQMEVNRLLRVMWLGTGLAAVGAGMALIFLTN